MRIALFHNAPSGGAKRAIQEWTIRLAANHELDVFTMSTADHEFCDLRPYVNHHAVFEYHPRTLLSSPFGRLNQLQRWRDLGDLIKLNRQIAERIDSGAYDVLFVHTCRFSVIPALLQFSKTPGVYYLHEPFGQGFHREIYRPYTRPNQLRLLVDSVDPLIKLYRDRLSSLQKESVKQTSLLLANSSFTQEHMRKEFSVETPVCHYGVNLQGFRPLPAEQKEDYIVSVGELSPRKGFDFLVESLGYIPQKDRPKLHIACNSIIPEEKDYVESLARERHVALEISTNLNMEQLAVLHNRAKFCVYAPVQEPFGLVPVEAMACEIPVIGVREGGVQESVVHGQTGLLVPRDPRLFAEAIQFLLQNPDIVTVYGRQAREHVLQQWSWEKSVEKLEYYLAECANRQFASHKSE
ncbi:MAG TPA: glycosyltransferase family 4 protein [Chloroflexota bacterium]|nr:glycosyltransferase family 4 protein [Chloroflexota bacterium]